MDDVILWIKNFKIRENLPFNDDLIILKIKIKKYNIEVFISDKNAYVISINREIYLYDKYQSPQELLELKLKDLSLENIISDISFLFIENKKEDGGILQDLENYNDFIFKINRRKQVNIKQERLSR